MLLKSYDLIKPNQANNLGLNFLKQYLHRYNFFFLHGEKNLEQLIIQQ